MSHVRCQDASGKTPCCRDWLYRPGPRRDRARCSPTLTLPPPRRGEHPRGPTACGLLLGCRGGGFFMPQCPRTRAAHDRTLDGG